MTLTIADFIVVLALLIAALTVVFSWMVWGTSNIQEYFAAGLIFGAAVGGLVGVFAANPSLGMLLGADIGGASGLIVFVLARGEYVGRRTDD